MTNKKKKIISMTLDEAKKEVLRLVQQGVNFREIAQIQFLIGDRIKKFSIGETSKIKNEAIGKVDESQNKFHDASFLFMLFDKGRHPKDIVIEYKLDPDYVQQVYKKYCEMNDLYVISQSIKDKIYEIAERISGHEPEDMDKAFVYVNEAAEVYFMTIEEEDRQDRLKADYQ